MRAADDELIRRLQERNADRKRATNDLAHPRKRCRPAEATDIRVLERALGFKLPEFLHAVYTQVGNGGFGPGYGIVGTAGGVRLDNRSLESCYQEMLQLEKENAIWRWPRRLLPLANYSCGMWACADCAYTTLPMVLWDPNNLDDELRGMDARRNWGNSFWDQGLSLRMWLEGWVNGKPEPEPKWPRNSWMRKRLGFAMPK